VLLWLSIHRTRVELIRNNPPFPTTILPAQININCGNWVFSLKAFGSTDCFWTTLIANIASGTAIA